MKLKLLLVSAFAMLLSICGSAQTTTIIGTGANAGTTGSNGSPIYRSSAGSSFDYSQSVLLYTFADLSAAGIFNGAVISSIGFNKTNAFGVAPGEAGSMTIGMNNSTGNSLDTVDTYANLTTGFTTVYTSAAVDETIITPAAGYVVFTLDTPFTYTGGSIEIGLDWDISVSTGNPTTGGFAFAYDTVTNVQGRGSSNSSPITTNLTTSNTRLYQAQMIYTGGTAPTCLPSTNLNAVSNTFDTADLSWTSGGSGETAWDIELGLEGFTPTGTPTNAGVANPYRAMALTANTGYDYYVRADCTGGDFSMWAGPFTFRTLCTAVTDFNENFDTVSTPDLPSCWSSFTTTPVGTTASVVQTSTAGDSSAPNGVRMYSGSLTGNIGSGTTDEGENILISPSLSNLAAGTHRIRFSADAGTATSTIEVGTMADATDPSTFTSLGTFTPTTTHAEYLQNFDTYSGTDQFIAFRHVFAGTFDTMYLDDIVWEAIPSCVDVSSPTIDSTTADSITVSWTENNVPAGTAWEVVVVSTGAAVPTAGASNATTNPFTVSGLTSNTAYDVYVRADCSTVFVGPVSVTTACDAFTAPYTEDFSSFTVASSAFTLENCWSGTGGSYFWESAAGTDTSSAGTGPSPTITTGNYFFTEASGGVAGDITDLVSPMVDLSALTSPALIFDYHMFGADIGTLDVLVNGTTNVFSISGEQQITDTTPFALAQVDLSAYTGQTISVTFRATSAGTFEGDIAIDNILFDELPACPLPLNLSEVAVTTTSVDVNVDSQNSTSNGDFEYVVQAPGDPAPTAPTGSFPMQTGGNMPNYTFSITGLTAATSYEVYVRENCTATENSLWVGPIIITTDCVAITDFSENFDGVSTPNLPVCWSSFVTTPMGTTAAVVQTSTTADSSAPNGIRMYSGSLTGNIGSGTTDEGENILVSPILSNLAAGTHRIKFSADAGTSTSTLEIGTMTDPNDPSTFTSVMMLAPTTTHSVFFIPIPSSTDEYVAFRHIFAGTFDTMYLDDIAWEAIPTCEAPLNASISSFDDTSATVSWTNNATNSTASSVEFGPVGFTLGTGTTVVGTADMAMLTGLMSNTSYDIYIQQDCGMIDGLSTPVGPLSLTTFPAGPAGLTCTSPGAAASSIFTENFTAVGSWTGDVATTGNQTWRFGEAGTTGSSATGPSDAQDTGGVYAYFESSSNTNAQTTATMVSPVIDLSTALDDVEVTFWMHAYGATIGTLNVRLSATTDFSMAPVAFTTSGQLQSDELDPWNQIGINAASFAGGNLYIQFEYTYDGSGFTSDFAIDELSVNTCFTCAEVTAITLDASTSDSATISWTENNVPPATSWEIVAVPAGDPAPAVGTVNATTNPFTVTGLSSFTAYDFYVRTDCSTSFTVFLNATTPAACGDMVFDTGGATGNYSNNEAYTLTYLPDAAGNLVTLDFTLVDLELCCDTLEVFDGLDVNATAFSTDLEAPASFRATNTDGAITVRFTSDGSVTGAGWEASYTCAPAPTCLEPSALMASNITTTTADLSWTSGGSGETAWDVEIVVAGTVATGTATDAGVTNPFMATALSSQTQYEYYVRAVCGMGDVSLWTGPFAFETPCAAVTMFPSTTDFATNVPNSCWNEAGDGEIAAGPTGLGSSDWRDGRAYTNGLGTVVPSNAINLFSTGDREWLISESYDLSSLTTKVLTVEVAVTDWTSSGTSTAADVATMGSDDSVDLLVTTDGGTTWTSLETWNVANQPAVIGDTYNYDLAAYSGTVQFAFLASDGLVNDPEDFDFHVSRFVVDATAGNGDVALENAVSLYPNPVTGDTMTINLGNVLASDASIAIYNALGQEVIYRDFSNVSNNTLVLDNLSSLTTGVYLVRITNGSSTTVKRFIKK